MKLSGIRTKAEMIVQGPATRVYVSDVDAYAKRLNETSCGNKFRLRLAAEDPTYWTKLVALELERDELSVAIECGAVVGGWPKRDAAPKQNKEPAWAAFDAAHPALVGNGCHASRGDGECHWEKCPQLAEGEPGKTGRQCPLDRHEEDE